MGLVPELASSRWLVQRVGFGIASDLVLSGRIIEAEEAHRARLVDRLVEPERLLDEALAVARSYATNPDPQLRMAKELLTINPVETDLALVQRREMEMLERCWVSPEHAEAVAAFREKRPPTFRRQER
jgi:enoyl-CoA hydratase/carnithine racemase